MTNVEIEDVLSSIRRLISDEPEKGNEARQETARPPGHEAPETGDEQDRLILTEALRVAESEGAAGADDRPRTEAATLPAAEEPEAEEPAPEASDGAGAEADSAKGASEAAEKVERVLASVSEREDDYEPEGVDVAAEYSPSPEFLRFSDAFAVSGEAANAPAAATGPQPEAEAPREAQPMGAGQAEPSGDGAHAEGAEAAHEPGTDEEPQGELDQSVGPEPVFAHARAEPAAEVGEVAEEEAESAPRAEFRHAGLTESWTDEPDDDEPGDFDLPIDEQALRDLIREVVRDELKGPLGERITRNLRKLVRREIHRIVTEREFD